MRIWSRTIILYIAKFLPFFTGLQVILITGLISGSYHFFFYCFRLLQAYFYLFIMRLL